MKELVPGEPLVAFHNVSIGFDEGDVLKGISFDLWPSETIVLLGVSGSGKTLILKLAAGLIRPGAGRVFVMGQNVGTMYERNLLDFRRNIGFVFQEGALFDSMSVEENVAFRMREEHTAEGEIEKRVRQALAFVEMEHAIDQFPAELSGGMRRRVSIARALVNQPRLVFYDSPTAGLDPITSQTIINLIMRGRDTQGVSSLLATHRVQDAFGLAHFRFDKATGKVLPLSTNGAKPVARAPAPTDSVRGTNGSTQTKIVVLRDGRIYFQGSTDEVLHSSDEYLKEFLASAE